MTSYTLQVQPQTQYTIEYSNQRGPQGPAGAAGADGPATTDASLLVSGTLDDARLSSNVALENVANVFTAKQSFSGTNHVGLCLQSLTTAQYNALTPANGDLFRDSTTDRIDARLARGTVELIDSAGGQTINGNVISTGTVTNQGIRLLQTAGGALRGVLNCPSWDTSYVALRNGTLAETDANTAIAQNSVGDTSVGAASGRGLSLVVGGAVVGLVTSTGIAVTGNLTASGTVTTSANSAASKPSVSLTGTWFSGGTGITNKPHFLIEPTGTTSTAWNTNGTAIGVNSASGFQGALIETKINNSTVFGVNYQGVVSGSGFVCASGWTYSTVGNAFYDSSGTLQRFRIGGTTYFTIATTGADVVGNLTASGTVRLGTYTVGTLPSAASNTRARAFVTDSNLAFNSTNLGSTVTAGGRWAKGVYFSTTPCTIITPTPKATDKQPEVIWDSSKPTTIPFRMVSTERLTNELGFEPTYTFEEGIKETVKWYKENHD